MRCRTIIILASVLLALSVCSCRKQESVGGSSEAASLTLSIGLPDISISTKARELYSGTGLENAGKIVTDPFSEDLSGWTDYEKLIDARQIYRLTVLLVNKVSGVLVGYRDLYKGSEDMRSAAAEEGMNGWWDGASVVTDSEYGTQAVVTFDYDHPLHSFSDGSSLECLERGLYRMIAVANWAPLSISEAGREGQTYNGLTDRAGNHFGDYVKSVLDQYGSQSASKHLKFSGADSEYTDYRHFMDFALHSSDDDFLCTLAPQPLVLVKDFELQPGMNKVSGQLLRTWARLRIAIENVSHDNLTVHDISFGGNTTRNESYLFFAPGNEAGSLTDPDENTKYGAPNIFKDSGEGPYNALVSAVKDTGIAGLNDGNAVVFFDGYILDSNGAGKEFTYNLKLEYEGKTVTKLKRAKTSSGEWDTNESEPYEIENGGLYVIQNQTAQKRILYAGAGQLETAVLSNDGSGNLQDKDYVFEPVQVFRFVAVMGEDGKIKTEEIEKTHVDAGTKAPYPLYNIQTYDRKYWLGTPRGDFAKNLPLVVDTAEPTSYVVRNDGFRDGDKYKDMRYLCFYSTKQGEINGRNFINVNGNSSLQHQVDGWKDNDAGSEFYLHKVAEVQEGAAFDGTVTLSVIDPDTAVSSPVTVIHRNDFINILITVAYNEHSGEIEFRVSEWNAGGGDIEFN